jgi:PE family
MSFVFASPQLVEAAAYDLANIGSAITDANAAAMVPTTSGVVAAGADEVSTSLAALFGAHGQMFQAISAQAATFHSQFVQLLNAGAGQYANTEVANIQQVAANTVSAPSQGLTGYSASAASASPVVPSGASSAALAPAGGVLTPAVSPAAGAASAGSGAAGAGSGVSAVGGTSSGGLTGAAPMGTAGAPVAGAGAQAGRRNSER